MFYDVIINISNAILIFGTVVIGLYILINGIKRHNSGLVFLSLFYLIYSLSTIIKVVFGLVWAQIAVLQSSAPIFLLEFTRRTFLRERKDMKNRIVLFYSGTIVTYILSVYFAYLYVLSNFSNRNLYAIGSTFDILSMTISLLFTVYASMDALKLLDPQVVERYVIRRIRLWRNLSILFIVTYDLWFIELPFPESYPILVAVIVFLSLIYMVLTYLLWVMPDFFKEYLNRDSDVSPAKISEAEYLEMKEGLDDEKLTGDFDEISVEDLNYEILHVLGSYLAKQIGRPDLACRGLIRFAAKKHSPNVKITQFNFNRWMQILDTPLIEQLQRVGLSIDEATTVCVNLRNDFLNMQSIITMIAH